MESSNFPFPLVHVYIAKAIAEACAAEGVQKLIHVSALGASASSKSRYYQTKAAGEVAVKAAFPTASIVRPAVMYGWEDRLFNRMAQASSAFPFLPLVDGGETKYQPVHGAIRPAPRRAPVPGSIREQYAMRWPLRRAGVGGLGWAWGWGLQCTTWASPSPPS
jgi:uncharacterized protein YbjT (DUF2867 family)